MMRTVLLGLLLLVIAIPANTQEDYYRCVHTLMVDYDPVKEVFSNKKESRADMLLVFNHDNHTVNIMAGDIWVIYITREIGKEVLKDKEGNEYTRVTWSASDSNRKRLTLAFDIFKESPQRDFTLFYSNQVMVFSCIRYYPNK